MIVGVPKEIYPGERRVALTPVVVPMLAKAGLEVVIEAGSRRARGISGRAVSRKRREDFGRTARVFSRNRILWRRYSATARTTRLAQMICR